MEGTVLHTVDWLLIVAFLIFSFAVGFFVKDKASQGGVEGFFTAGRDMKWWFLGTSIVATTFASDTPLAITGWVAKYGIAGNWFWWGGVLGTLAMTVFFARKWRTSGVVTDVEITELRYGGKPAMILRSVKAFISSTFVNCIILGWVFAGMAKISEPFMDWQYVLGTSFYTTLEGLYPSFMIFKTFDNTITIWILVAVTMAYSTMGGLRAVIVTDMVQFVLAMGMSIGLTWMAVVHVGGLEQMWAKLATLYPDPGGAVEMAKSAAGEVYLPASNVSAFIPDFSDNALGSLGIPFSAFMLTLGMLWWTNGNIDGSGYIAQRLYTAKDGGQAEKGALWYAYANFLMRSWPWAIAGVAALVIYPRVEVDNIAREFTMCINDRTKCTVKQNACLENRYTCEITEFGLLQKGTGTLEQDGLNPKITPKLKERTITLKAELVALSAKNSEVTDDSLIAESALKATALKNQIIDIEQNVENRAREVSVYRDDRERSYPALIKDVLPVGLIGLALAALMAAFMSTISTHINWGASYVANDFYYRFVNPNASEKQLTFVSRMATIGIAVMGVFVANFIDDIGSMWELYGGMMAGLGLPHMMRWLWWRANAWTEIVGMLVGFFLAFANYIIGQQGGFPEGQMSIFPTFMATHPIEVICWVSVVAGVASIIATYATAPVPDKLIQEFVEKIKPMGWWKGFNKGHTSERGVGASIYYWLLGSLSIYAGMFGIGFLLRVEIALGVGLLVLCLVTLVMTVRGMDKIDRKA
jgi:solute:Na+ symporter, SSS family